MRMQLNANFKLKSLHYEIQNKEKLDFYFLAKLFFVPAILIFGL